VTSLRSWILPLAAITVALGARPAAAQSAAAPAVKKLNPEEGPLGAAVVCDGVNFSDKKEDFEVTVEGLKCFVVQASPERVTFIIPGKDLAVGSHTVTIKVKGASCTSKFKVIAFKNKQEELKWRDIQRQKYEGVGKYEDPFKQTEAFLKIEKFEITKGENPYVSIEGSTTIPQGFFIGVVFGSSNDGEREIETRRLQVKGNNWKAIFGPYTGKTILAGRYYCMATFDMARQDALTMKRNGWPDKLDEGQRVAYSSVWKREFREYGTKEDMAKEAVEIRDHYLDLCRRTTDSLESLERANAALGRIYAKNASGSGIDEKTWNDWITSRGGGLGQTEEDLKKIKADVRFVRGEHFNPDAWQTWIESDLRAKLLDVAKGHQAIKDKYVGTLDEHLPVEGDMLISIVVKLSQLYSTEIFKWCKLDLPDALKVAHGFSGGFEAQSASRPAFEGQRNLLLQRIKATLPPPAPAPSPAPAPNPPPKKDDSAGK
jgi:hypothetical protein